MAATAPAAPFLRPVTLHDGSRVELRLMQAADAPAVARFHAGLSPQTVLSRFLGVHPRLSDHELAHFTHVDHRSREAIVAEGGGAIVGIARFDRIGSTSDAEVAFVVADAWQGRGLGTALFQRLASRARDVGITRFVALTAASNQRMLAVLDHAGHPVEMTRDAGVVSVTVDLTLTRSARAWS